MSKEFIDYIENEGWTIVCESPLNIEHTDGDIATGLAADYVIEALDDEWCGEKNEKLRSEQPPAIKFDMKVYGDTPFEEVEWTKYKIVVPTEEDKLELEMAFEHIHFSDVDSEYIVVNQLMHDYLTPEITGNETTKNNIMVIGEERFNILNDE